MRKQRQRNLWMGFITVTGLLFCLSQALLAQTNTVDEAAMLEKKIKIYNRDFCPPRSPIREISDRSLLKLVAAELIERTDMERFRNMIIVDGKVENPAALEYSPKLPSGNNLAGDLESACEEMSNKKTRGRSEGNRKPEKLARLKARRISYRDRDNQLKEMEIYSPPKSQAKKKKKVKDKKGRKIKDYATSNLLPKNAENDTAGSFSNKPSADAWIDDD